MHPALRRTAVTALIVAFLIPGLALARTPFGDWSTPSASVRGVASDGFFSMVWNLLTNFLGNDGGALTAKDTTDNGGHLDPNGATATTTTTSTTDNGGHLDPNGG